MQKKLFTALTLMILLAVGIAASAQDFSPVVEVNEQVSVDGTVIIDRVVSDGPGWLVIHADNGEGAPGEVIGYRSLNAGENLNFKVEVDMTRAKDTLHAMLHFDNSEVGTYEFDGSGDIDAPVVIDGNVINIAFDVDAVAAQDQFVSEGSVTIPAVVSQNEGWLVVHADNGESAPGPVLGVTFVESGLNTNVPVELNGDVTSVLFPMLHNDTGASGEYEFDTVDGEDLPVSANGQVAVAQFATVPSVTASQQIVFDTFVADSVLSDGDGWLVIHADAGGGPGAVIGAQFVEDGYSENVEVALNVDAGITPVVYPMLHTDTGESGEYEFGEVEGADAPVTINGNPLTFPMLVAPSITALAQPVKENGSINIATALINSHGWLVIHADNGEGQPGAVIGVAPLMAGLNENVGVQLTDEATDTVYPMLHYDTNTMGEYEFGEVSGADAPVRVNDSIVFTALEIQ